MSVSTPGGLSEAERKILQVAPFNIAVLICALSDIAGQLTTEEGDDEATEDTFGLPVGEVVAMAHDNMIDQARLALKRYAGMALSSISKQNNDGGGDG